MGAPCTPLTPAGMLVAACIGNATGTSRRVASRLLLDTARRGRATATMGWAREAPGEEEARGRGER